MVVFFYYVYFRKKNTLKNNSRENTNPKKPSIVCMLIELNDLDFANADRPAANSFDGNTYWQKEIFKSGIVQDHNIAFSGGNKDSRHFISGNYQHNLGTEAGMLRSVLIPLPRKILKIRKTVTYVHPGKYFYRTGTAESIEIQV